MKNFAVISILAAAVFIGVFAITITTVQAATNGQSLIEKLADRFNLNEDEVKTFFDEQRQERHQLIMQSKEERLNQAVADGVITEEQKQALINKFAEKQAEREQHHEEMQAWFEQQGIDPEALWQYGGFGHQMGFGRWHKGFK